jgi:hypothetical protein
LRSTCLAALHSTTRSLEKALADVACETRRVTSLLEKEARANEATQERVLRFPR